MTKRRVRRVRRRTEEEPQESAPVKQEEEPRRTRRARTPRTFGQESGNGQVDAADEEPTLDDNLSDLQAAVDAVASDETEEEPLEEEEEEPIVRRSRTRRRRAEPEEVDATEPKEEPAPRRISRRRSRRAEPEPEPEVEEPPPEASFAKEEEEYDGLVDEEPEPEPEEEEDWDESEEAEESPLPVQATDNEIANAIITLLAVGKSVNIMQVGTRYVISEGAEMRQISKRSTYAMTKEEMEIIAMTDDYKEFSKWWPNLTWEEKVSEAKEKKVTWERHDDAQVDNIRATVAYRKKLGIRKWKPPYKTRRAREDLWKKGIRAE